MPTLTDQQIESFVVDGFVHVPEAFPRVDADRCRELLWEEIGPDPDDPETWTEPVVRVAGRADGPFSTVADTPRLRSAYDQLVGEGLWEPRRHVGTIPIRFPHPDAPEDDGWHIDAGWHVAQDDPTFDWSDLSAIDPNGYRVNLRSRGRSLLMLFLFSEVGVGDAPTRIRVGSHLRIPPLLEAAGDGGTKAEDLPPTDDLPTTLATGEPGDVYLCHPFLVHAAQANRAG